MRISFFGLFYAFKIMETKDLKNKISKLYSKITSKELKGVERLSILIEIQDLEMEVNYRKGQISN